MSTADVLLAVLHAGPSHGYDVKRAHDSWFPDSRPLAFGQVYSTLGRLGRDGFVEVVEARSEGAPEKTVYALTDAGRQRLQTWLAEPEALADRGADELVRKTVAALRTDGDAAGFLTRQRVAHLRRMRELAAQDPASGLAGLARDHQIAQLDADLRWLETAAQRDATTPSEPS